jgi:HTH-type transcriptional regulator / antitoxin HigA
MNYTINIRAIRNEKRYTEYLSIVDELMDIDPEPESQEGELLETLSILIEDYEKKKGYDLPDTLDPVEVIKIRMKELDLKQNDLVPVMGDKATVSRILHKKRNLTYDMVGKLCELLKIPANLLIKVK